MNVINNILKTHALPLTINKIRPYRQSTLFLMNKQEKRLI